VLGHLFGRIVRCLRAIGSAVEANEDDGLVERLRTKALDAAGDWGVNANGTSKWLPSGAPVALLAACLMLRASPLTYGEFVLSRLLPLKMIRLLLLSSRLTPSRDHLQAPSGPC
jgi:hypothetical protein